MDSYEKTLQNRKTRLISISEVSNVLGTIVPIREIVKKADAKDVPVLVDAVSRYPICQLMFRLRIVTLWFSPPIKC